MTFEEKQKCVMYTCDFSGFLTIAFLCLLSFIYLRKYYFQNLKKKTTTNKSKRGNVAFNLVMDNN